MKTILTISIQQLLRYTIISILVFGLVELVLNSVTAIIAPGFIASVFLGMLSTVIFTVVFYSIHLQILSKKTPESRKTPILRKGLKSTAYKEEDWVDSLLKDVDKPDNR